MLTPVTGSGGANALATYVVQTATNAPANAQVLGSLSTGLVKVTTSTGVLSTATAGTDYLAPSGNGSGLTNLAATNLASGTVPTARLGSGTASSSTFLRGDQTYTSSLAGTFICNTGSTKFLMDGATVSGFSGLWCGSATQTTANWSFLSNGTTVTGVSCPTGGATSLRCGGTALVVSDASTASVPRVIVGYNPAGTAGDPAASFSSLALNSTYSAATFVGAASQTASLTRYQQLSSTSTLRSCGYIDATFNTATDASWTGILSLYVGDYGSTNLAKRLGIQIQSNGSVAQLGFFGVTPVSRPATPTTLADVIALLQSLGLSS